MYTKTAVKETNFLEQTGTNYLIDVYKAKVRDTAHTFSQIRAIQLQKTKTLNSSIL